MKPLVFADPCFVSGRGLRNAKVQRGRCRSLLSIHVTLRALGNGCRAKVGFSSLVRNAPPSKIFAQVAPIVPVLF